MSIRYKDLDIKQETPIDRAHARKILELDGWSSSDIREELELDRLQDYYLVFTEDGEEYLWGYGEDSPIAQNGSTTSWAQPY